MASPQVHIIDGGFGTEAEVLKEARDQTTEWMKEIPVLNDDPLWSARLIQMDPDLNKAVHRKFLEAGADYIESNTYQASTGLLKKCLNVTDEEACQILGRAVQLAQESVDEFIKTEDFKNSGRDQPQVVGAIGPYAISFHNGSEYSGEYLKDISEQELKDWHRPKIQALVSAGANFLALETIPGTKEAKALVELLRDEFSNVKAWLAFSCKDGSHTCTGDVFSSAIQVAKDYDNIVAVGVNCSNSKFVTPLLKSAQGFSKDFIVYPNSGEEYIKNRWDARNKNYRPLDEYVPEWLDLGVRWIGGCCRVYSTHIADIKRAVEKYQARS